ncbi:MAG: signal protein PDZ, partial [Bacillota bacterium]|nr:signal protein PDZ [Bacillota bacterium]
MDLAIYTLRAAASAIVDPTIAPTLIILALILYFQNRKTAMMQKIIVGESLNSPLELTVSQIVLGIFGGVLASILLSYFGVLFDENSGIYFIFMISIILMMFKPRFICFSYSGAIIGALSLIVNDAAVYITGRPLMNGALRIDITALMTLVGILHVVEGILVYIDGHRGAIPVFTSSEGRIMGGFAFKRFWPIPVVLLLLTAINQGGISADTTPLNSPGWWPLINSPYALSMINVAIAAAPFFAVLGHNSITFTRNKREKARSSGLGILLYGIVLTGVAQLGAYNIFLKIFVLLFAPLAHEYMLRLQSYRE